MPPTPKEPIERFFSHVEITETCWLWTGNKHPAGYGHFFLRKDMNQKSIKILSHRWAYANLVGPIPAGLEIDHLCRVRLCVNPDHLEPVTHRENGRRGDAGKHLGALQRAKTHCASGHPFDPANTYIRTTGHRACRECKRAYDRRVYVRANRIQASPRTSYSAP